MKVLVFAGTSEGRILVDFMSEHFFKATVCVATDHGMAMIKPRDNINIIAQRQDTEDMKRLIREHDIIIDATHPFAKVVSTNIVQANNDFKKPYYRIVRDFFELDGALMFDSLDSACTYLSDKKGNILATTGSKLLAPYLKISNYQERVYFRVLPMLDSIQACLDHNIKINRIIAMQGPFSESINTALINEYNIKYMVTKNTGGSGGLKEKIESAIKMNVTLLVIEAEKEQGYSIEQMKKIMINIKEN